MTARPDSSEPRFGSHDLRLPDELRGPLVAHLKDLRAKYLVRGWGHRVGFGGCPAVVVIDFGTLALALLLVQFVGIPFTFLFGAIADRIGPKQAIYIGLAVYTVIAIVGYRMTSAADFFTLAILVGTVQGGSQALSRSLFATMIPKQKSAEFFGFFGVFEKFAGIFGPALFAGMISLTGSSRPAILGIIVFFVVGGALLAFVDVDEGRRAARAAEARLQGA